MADNSKTDEATRPADIDHGQAPSPGGDLVPVHQVGGLPAPQSAALLAPRKTAKKNWWLRIAVVVAVLAGAGGGGYYWWQHMRSQLPPGIAYGNGRLEADAINIDTKYAGRIAELFADEGDLVKGGQVVARMDTQDLAASLKKAQAQVKQASRAVEEADANVKQQQTQALLAQQEYDRAAYLVQKGFQTKEVMDQRQQQLDGARPRSTPRTCGYSIPARARRRDPRRGVLQRRDRRQYAGRAARRPHPISRRQCRRGSAGRRPRLRDARHGLRLHGHLFADRAGRQGKVRRHARIVLDAYPKVAIPAKVLFIATQAQFTPKTVETQNEREKLMFRVRVRIDADWLRGRTDAVSSGLPGRGLCADRCGRAIGRLTGCN